ESITLSGQLAIKFVEKYVNDKLNQVLGTTDVDYVVAIDTDSVSGDSMIWVDDKQIAIEQAFDAIAGELIVNDKLRSNFVKVPNKTLMTKSCNSDGQVESKRISYLMKHKVSKGMYRVTVGDKSVVVTEDHSI